MGELLKAIDLAANAASHETTVHQAAGNAIKIIIVLTKDTNSRIISDMVSLGLISSLIELIKKAKDGPVRKNAAIALARLAKKPQWLQAIRDLRGMEILL